MDFAIFIVVLFLCDRPFYLGIATISFSENDGSDSMENSLKNLENRVPAHLNTSGNCCFLAPYKSEDVAEAIFFKVSHKNPALCYQFIIHLVSIYLDHGMADIFFFAY